MSYVCPYASTLVSTSALGPVGCWEPRMFAPAGEGAYPAVPPVPVPASARKLQAALWVWQPAGGSQLWPQHGDLCRTEEQLGRRLLHDFVMFYILKDHESCDGIAKYLKADFTVEARPIAWSVVSLEHQYLWLLKVEMRRNDMSKVRLYLIL